MSDNFRMQVASFGSWFKSRLIAGVHHPGHISYKEDGTPVDHATEDSLVQILALLRGAGFNVALPAGAATSSNQVTANVTLASILSALTQRAESVWTDDSGAFYIRIDAGGTITWTTVTGGASGGPGTGARPAAGTAAIVDRVGYQATVNGTGYSSNDLLDHFVTLDPSTGAILGHFWINATTEALIAAPAAGNIVPIAPLPTGAATSANQASANTSLADIDGVLAAFKAANHTDLASIVTALATNHTDELQLHTDIATTLLAKDEAIRALLAGTLAISAAALPLPAGAATAANQATANTSLADIDGVLAAFKAANHTDLASIVTALATNHTDELQLHTDIATALLAKDEAIRALLAGTLAISAAALPLPAGAATEATLTGLKALLPASLGQKTGANSLSVVLSSDGPFATNFGLQADAAVTDPTASASGIALFKGILKNQGLGTRPMSATATFTPSASGTYGNSICIGGKLIFDFGVLGLPGGMRVFVDGLSLNFVASALSAGAPAATAFIFNANPATAFTDGTTPAIAAADAALLIRSPVTLAGITVQAFGLWSNGIAGALGQEAFLDNAGKLYVGLTCGGAAPTYTSPQLATVTLSLRC